MEVMTIGTHGWGYTENYLENGVNSFSIMKMFSGKKTSFMFHKFCHFTSLLISGKAKLRLYDPGKDWFDKIDYNQTMAANWHDLADIKELVKSEYFSILPGVVFQMEAIEDCKFVYGGNQLMEIDTFVLFNGD